MNVQLFIIPIAAFNDKLHFYVVNKSLLSNGEYSLGFPESTLSSHLNIYAGTRSLLKDYFSDSLQNEPFTKWFNSPQCQERIINVYDRDRLPEGENSIAIVRAVCIPDYIATTKQGASGYWHEPQFLLADHSNLSADNKVFLTECLNLIPVWVKNTSFTFELMCQVFSIQELRLLVGMLSNQEIDPGNFHRRLKKLDILRPLGTGQQRVHRWEFVWDRMNALSSDGLIP